MSDVTVVAGDTAPSLFGTLTDSAGDPIDLSGATVRFQMREAIDRRYSISAVATIVDATTGSVRYDWQAGDLSTPGTFVSRWLVTFVDSSLEHTSPENTITVETP